jgi:subtilase family serine protease
MVEVRYDNKIKNKIISTELKSNSKPLRVLLKDPDSKVSTPKNGYIPTSRVLEDCLHV